MQALNTIGQSLQQQVVSTSSSAIEGVLQSVAVTQLDMLEQQVAGQFSELSGTIDLSLLDAASQNMSKAAEVQQQAAQNMLAASQGMMNASVQQSTVAGKLESAAGQLASAAQSIPSRITVQSNIIVPEVGGR